MTMHRRHFCLLATAALAAAAPAAFANDERAKPEEAKALLAKAVAHIKSAGKDKALADFMTKAAPWVDRDLYITVYDLSGKTLATAANHRAWSSKDN